MPTIRKRGNRFNVLVRVTGHRTQSQTFDTEREAVRWGDEVEQQIKGGTFLAAGKQLFRNALPAYLVFMRSRHHRTELEIEKQLQDWCEVLGGYKLERIRPRMVAAERDRLARELSPGTVNRRLAALSGFFKWALEQEALVSNPVHAVRKMREPRHRIRYLSEEEREALFTACKKQTECPILYALVATACYTGMRQGELLRLNWSDVDLNNGWASVHWSKNEEPRTVPVAGPALEALQQLRAQGVKGRGKKVRNIADRPMGKVFGRDTFPTKAWRRTVKKAKLVNFRFHDLRHCAASYLVQSGAELAEVAEILGHKTLSMTQKYAHMSPKRVAGAMERMVQQFK